MNNTIAEHNDDPMKKMWGHAMDKSGVISKRDYGWYVLPKNGVLSKKIWPDVLQQLGLYPRKEEPDLMAFPFCYNAPLVSP